MGNTSSRTLHPAWRDYRLRSWTAWALFLGTGPVAILAKRSGVALGPYDLVLGVPMVVAFLRLALFRCPRCGERFHWSWHSNAFARHCLHCGLRKYADPVGAAGNPRRSV